MTARLPALLADLDAALARLAREPATVRDALGRLAILTFLVGDRGDDGDRLVEAIVTGLGLDEHDVQRLIPHGHVALESVPVIAPADDATRDLAFLLICGVAATTRPPTRTQLQALVHLGLGLGLPEAVVREQIGVELELPRADP